MKHPVLPERLVARLSEVQEEFVRTLSDYLRVPTISAHGTGYSEGAAATRKILETAGARVQTHSVDGGPPVVIGEIEADTDRPWLILYNHYDVQPVDPLEQWRSDPFDPVVRDGKLIGRGVSDTKGNTVAQALAIQIAREQVGALPMNIRFFVEGEEESSSPHLAALARQNAKLFEGLGATIEAAARSPDGRPVIALGSKGVASFELEVRTAAVDQHSSLAASLPNAAWRLISALRSLRREDGRILIDGFYEDIERPDRELLRLLRRNTMDPAVYRDEYGATTVFGGDSRYSRLKRAYLSPTCTIDGIVSGYTGPGHKTVNPAEARAKLDFRLVPNQRTKVVAERLRSHLADHGFGDVNVREYGGFEPAAAPATSPLAQAAIRAAESGYELPANVVPWGLGASTTAYFMDAGTPALEPPGVGNSASHIHAPNENIRLEDVVPAMKATVGLIYELAGSGSKR